MKALKVAYKAASGSEWSPTAAAPQKTVEKSPSAPNVDALNSQIKTAGDKVRDLKTKKAEKVQYLCLWSLIFNKLIFNNYEVIIN